MLLQGMPGREHYAKHAIVSDGLYVRSVVLLLEPRRAYHISAAVF